MKLSIATLFLCAASVNGFSISMSSTGYMDKLGGGRAVSIAPKPKTASSGVGKSYTEKINLGVPASSGYTVPSSYGGFSYGSTYGSSATSPQEEVRAAAPAKGSYLDNLKSSSLPSFSTYTAPATAAKAASSASYLDNLKSSSLPSFSTYTAPAAGSYLDNLKAGSSSPASTYSATPKTFAATPASRGSYLDNLKGASLPSFSTYTAPLKEVMVNSANTGSTRANVANSVSYLENLSRGAIPAYSTSYASATSSSGPAPKSTGSYLDSLASNSRRW